MYVKVNAAGEWLQDEFNFTNANLVASSRSGATEVWQLEDGRLVQVAYYKSGNIDLCQVDEIPYYLTVRY